MGDQQFDALMASAQILFVTHALMHKDSVYPVLVQSGFNVTMVQSGEAALASLDARSPDLVLCAYRLPGMNGAQLVRQFRINAQMRSTPILMLTEDNVSSGEYDSLESGADAYLSASAHPDLLILRIRALLRRGPDLTQCEEVGNLRRARIVIVMRSLSQEQSFPAASWERDALGATLGELLWREGHTVTTINDSAGITEGGWLGGGDGPDCLVLDLTAMEDDAVAFCRKLDSRRRDVLGAGGSPFRMIGIVEVTRFKDYSAAALFDAGLDDLVPSDIASGILALRIRGMARRKLAQDDFRREEMRRQAQEADLRAARNEASAIAAKAAMAEALSRANEELEAAHTRLLETQTKLVQAAKMASLGELVAGIAHEINNPLAFTLAHEETVTRLLHQLQNLHKVGSPLPGEIVEKGINRMGSMRVGLQRIQNLVLSLRRFSRLDESAFRSVDVPEAIETALALLSNKRGRNITIETVLNAPKIFVCQPALFHQVVMNIVSNAIDAIRSDEDCPPQQQRSVGSGRVIIETGLSQMDGMTTYEIAISDNGPGVPPENHARIFEPFFTTKAVGEGTGLGLSIAYGVIKAHGGVIEVEKATIFNDTGAQFRVCIPVDLTDEGPVTRGPLS